MRLALEQYRGDSSTVWTVHAPLHTLHIVLPWNAIERLRDHFGDYVLIVTCRACRHSREITPAFLARHCRAGWDTPLANIIARLRCRCGKKGADVQIGFNRKPRGWVKNPS